MFSLDDHPGIEGLDLLRKSANHPEWLRQPSQDAMTFFKKHNARPYYGTSERSALHRYDKNAAHLGAASSVKLGAGEPIWYDQAPPFADRAGLWHITLLSGPTFPELPALCKDDAWLYTPTLALLARLGGIFELHEAFLFSEQHQTLRRFYEQMAVMRQQDRERAKKIYTVFFGMLARAPKTERRGYLWRPDWYYTLVAETNARMWLNMLTVYQQEGIAPAKVEYDCLSYERPVSSLPLGSGIGQFKYTQEEDA